jgi:hypothetical protein
MISRHGRTRPHPIASPTSRELPALFPQFPNPHDVHNMARELHSRDGEWSSSLLFEIPAAKTQINDLIALTAMLLAFRLQRLDPSWVGSCSSELEPAWVILRVCQWSDSSALALPCALPRCYGSDRTPAPLHTKISLRRQARISGPLSPWTERKFSGTIAQPAMASTAAEMAQLRPP